MNDNNNIISKWIKLGIISGLLSSVIYPSLIFIPLPAALQVAFIMAWGPLLGLSAVGLYYFISLHNRTVSSQIAVVSQIIAGVLVTLMLLVQYAIRSAKPLTIDAAVWDTINHVQLGIDVAWDLFIFLSTLLFAINMYNHPRLGKVLSISGVVIGILMITFNILTFPTPPAEAESFDMGPLVGLWGLAVTINILIRYKWIEAKLNET